VLGGVDFMGSFEFFLILSFSCSFCFGFELFLAILCILLGLPPFVLLLALQLFSSSR
jgi:hypothetical protein